MGVEHPERVAGRGRTAREDATDAADGVLEACWLVALALVPLFVQRDAARAFEPGKAAVVRALACVMLAAWVARALARDRSGTAGRPSAARAARDAARLARDAARVARNTPLVAAVPAALVVAAAAAAASPSPGVSLEGGAEDAHGLTTLLAYGAIFLVAATALRTRAQVERAVTVVLAAGTAVAAYGLAQRLGLDPLAWRRPPALDRPGSTLGGPGPLGGYLVVVAPLAFARLLQHAERAAAARARPDAGWWLTAAGAAAAAAVAAGWVAAAAVAGEGAAGPPAPGRLAAANVALLLGLAGVAAVVAPWAVAARRRRERGLAAVGVSAGVTGTVVSALLLTQSRGAFAGLLVAAGTMTLAAAVARRSRGLAAAAVAGALVVALAVAAGAAGDDRRPPEASPEGISRLVDPGGGSTRVRLLLWEAGVDAVLPHEPLVLATGRRDHLDALRPLIGYGPDATAALLARFQRPELTALEAPGARADRLHNQTLEALVQTGVLGALAYLAVLAALLRAGWEALDPAGPRAARRSLAALVTGGALVAAAAGAIAGGLHLAVVAVPAGMVLGFLAGLLATGWRRGARGRTAGEGRAAPARWTAAGVAAGLAGHVVESQLGVVSAATTVTFWVLAAALVALARPDAREDGRAPGAPATSAVPAGRGEDGSAAAAGEPLPALAALAGLMTGALVFALVNHADLDAPGEGVGRLALRTLAAKGTTEGLRPSLGVACVLVTPALVMAALTAAERGARPPASPRRHAGAGVAALAAAAGAAFAVPHLVLQSRGAPVDAGRAVWALAVFAVFALAAGVQVAAALRGRGRAGAWTAGGVPWLGGLVAAVLVLGTAGRPAIADILLGQAGAPGADRERAVTWAQRAHDLQPTVDHPLAVLADGWTTVAAATPDARERAVALRRAARALDAGRRLDPLDADTLVVQARMHRRAAAMPLDGPARDRHLARAGERYRQAIRAAPALADVQSEHAAALIDRSRLLAAAGRRRRAAALRHAAGRWSRRAMAIDPRQPVARAVRDAAAQAAEPAP